MDALIEKLGIHWMQLLAQVVNFLVIAGALTILLYRPILRVLDERKARIQKSMNEVARIERQAKDLDALRAEALRTLDKETGALMEKAMKDAESLRQEILVSARKEADQLIAKAHKQAEDERRALLTEAQRKLTDIILHATEKLLSREFSSDDQRRIESDLKTQLPSLIS